MQIALARIGFLVALAAAAVGCNQQQQAQQASAPAAAPAAISAAASPDATVLASIKALRANNVAAVLENALPPGELTKIKAEWSHELNKEPITDEDRRKFNDDMAKLTAPGAEDRIYAEIAPQLKQFEQQSAAQMPMMIAMGQGFIQSAINQNKELNDQQKQQTLALIDAAGKWAQTAKFTDAALAKQAIGVVCKTARDLNLKSLDEVRALSYDQGMQKAGIALAGAKQLFALYGLSMDKALDSVKVETVSTNGDSAKVKETFTAFDQPFTSESELVKVNGKWFSKQAIDQWNKREHSEMAHIAPPAAAEPASTAK